MPRVPTTRDAVKKVILDHGPMTCAQIARLLGRKRHTISSCVNEANESGKKHFCIVGYDLHVGGTGRPAAIFAIGDAPKVLRPSANEMSGWALRRLSRKVRRIDPFASLITQVTK
jgi:hypothetical protein